MSVNFSKVINNFLKSKISKTKKIDKNTKFEDLKEFDSLNFVKLIIHLNKYSINIESEQLSKIKKIGDLIKLSDLGSIQDAKNAFGGLPKLKQAYYQLQENIYIAS